MPTLAQLAGVAYPEAFTEKRAITDEGKSLLPLLSGEQSHAEHRRLFFEHMGDCAVIEGDWKAVRLRERAWELYHLGNDRSETHNLTKSKPAIVSELVSDYQRWAEKNDILPRSEVEKQIPFTF